MRLTQGCLHQAAAILHPSSNNEATQFPRRRRFNKTMFLI